MFPSFDISVELDAEKNIQVTLKTKPGMKAISVKKIMPLHQQIMSLENLCLSINITPQGTKKIESEGQSSLGIVPQYNLDKSNISFEYTIDPAAYEVVEHQGYGRASSISNKRPKLESPTQ